MFNLTPWQKKEPTAMAPYRGSPLSQMRDEFDALLDRFLSRWPAAFEGDWDKPTWGMDVQEDDREVCVKAEMPGFEPDDLDVQVSGQLLTIKAEHREDKTENGVEQRSHRSFHRSMTLPFSTSPDKIEAKYRNGILEVHVPKSEQAKGKRIPIAK